MFGYPEETLFRVFDILFTEQFHNTDSWGNIIVQIPFLCACVFKCSSKSSMYLEKVKKLLLINIDVLFFNGRWKNIRKSIHCLYYNIAVTDMHTTILLLLKLYYTAVIDTTASLVLILPYCCYYYIAVTTILLLLKLYYIAAIYTTALLLLILLYCCY